ncbi:MAG: hypothetical protein Q8L88_01745 [Bacteroidota bacterium]|nr:hypothetical protein [Bacteroidota bacterium]
MSTIAPSTEKAFDDSTLEKIAYNSIKSIPTREQNDQYRLGYHLWQWLSEKQGTLEQAVKNSGSRILISDQETIAIIKQELQKSGINL